jgi:hypothetical protein
MVSILFNRFLYIGFIGCGCSSSGDSKEKKTLLDKEKKHQYSNENHCHELKEFFSFLFFV